MFTLSGQYEVNICLVLGMEVPILVNNQLKWISGILPDTTCSDVIKEPAIINIYVGGQGVYLRAIRPAL